MTSVSFTKNFYSPKRALQTLEDFLNCTFPMYVLGSKVRICFLKKTEKHQLDQQCPFQILFLTLRIYCHALLNLIEKLNLKKNIILKRIFKIKEFPILWPIPTLKYLNTNQFRLKSSLQQELSKNSMKITSIFN